MADIGLPTSVLDLVEMHPIEDIALHILRADLPDVPSISLIEEDPRPFFIVVRRKPTLGDWGGDSRFVDRARLTVHVFAQDPDGDEKGALIAEAVRVVFRNAWLNRRTIAGLGAIVRIDQIVDPSRKSDWATATGPVQYADLPTGYHRYESEYEFWIRKPRK